MAKKLVKGIYRFFEFLLGFIIILTILLFIRLSKGPIDIKNLIESYVGENADTQIGMKDAVLEMALSEGQLMSVRINELSVLNKEGFALTVEKASVSFNPFWLLVGRFAPRAVELEKPYIHLNLADSSPKPQEETTEEKVPVCRQINRIRRYVEQLDSLNITDGEVALNLGGDESILFPNLEFSLSQKEDDKMDFLIQGLFSFKDTSTNWKITANYDLDDKIMTFSSMIDDVDLVKLHPIVPILKGTDLSFGVNVDGKLNLSLLKQGWQEIFENITFDVSTKKEGVLFLPDPLNTTYQIQNISIKGDVSSKFDKITLKDSNVKILDKTISVGGGVSGLANFINTQDLMSLHISLNAETGDIPIKKVPDLWPSSQGTDAYDWVKENITEGNVKKATFTMNMTGIDVDNLESVIDVEGATVRYVDEMKPAKNVKAVVTIGTDNVDIKVLDGYIEKVQAVGGYVKISDMDKDVPVFNMDIEVKGNIPNVLDIVSTEPLLICKDMPIPCKGIKGNAKGHVHLAFDFVDEKLEDTIKYNVSADLDEVSLPVPETKWDFSEGSLKLFVNDSKLTIQGKGLLDEKPIQMDITHLFKGTEGSTYLIRLPVTASMIAPYFDKIDNFLKGSLMTSIIIKPVSEKEMSVLLEFGLKDAEISLPIGYVKEFNKKGTLKATLSVVGEKLVAVPSIYLSMPDEDILITGKVDLPKDKVFDLNLTEIKAPRTDASILFSYYKNDNFDVKLKGKSADISDLLHGDFFAVRQVGEEKETTKKEAELPKIKDFTVEASVDTLYLSEKKEPFKNVSAKIVKKDGIWQKIEGSLKGKGSLKVALNKEKTALTIETDNVGDILNRAGLTDRIKGGTLDSTLAQEKDGSLKGTIKIKNYELTDTDFFMQAATLLGIVDAIRGDTISFDKAVIPFVLSPTHVVTIEDAVAFGTAVGITISGKVDSENIDLNGSVAPAYAVNSLPGKIPVFGSLLTGEEGGGMFGVSYSIKGKTSNPETTFNPASLLTPGIFRKIFDVF